jgi:hypothetical protein
MASKKTEFINSVPVLAGCDDGESDGICVEELHASLAQAIKDGYGQSIVYFDAEARTFKCHWVRVNDATMSPTSDNGIKDMFILTTRYH